MAKLDKQSNQDRYGKGFTRNTGIAIGMIGVVNIVLSLMDNDAQNNTFLFLGVVFIGLGIVFYFIGKND